MTPQRGHLMENMLPSAPQPTGKDNTPLDNHTQGQVCCPKQKPGSQMPSWPSVDLQRHTPCYSHFFMQVRTPADRHGDLRRPAGAPHCPGGLLIAEPSLFQRQGLFSPAVFLLCISAALICTNSWLLVGHIHCPPIQGTICCSGTT